MQFLISHPAALASLLFEPPKPATFLPLRAPWSSFYWLFLFSDSFSSLTSLTTVVASVHKSEVWLLKFLRLKFEVCRYQAYSGGHAPVKKPFGTEDKAQSGCRTGSSKTSPGEHWVVWTSEQRTWLCCQHLVVSGKGKLFFPFQVFTALLLQRANVV